MSKDYIWNLTDLKDVPKNGYKVFTCFSCGGGSSMGYKLAGYEVLGNCEIDPKINEMYVKNHHPKYNFLMGVQDFYKQDNIPEELFNLDVLDGSPPCFTAGAKVRTDLGYKNIEDIRIGDLVWTHKGRFCRVYDVMSKQSEDLYNVKVMGAMPITVTGNHPFYVRRMVKKGHGPLRVFGEPEWKSARDLSIVRAKCGGIREQDYIGIPIIKEEIPIKWDGITVNDKIKNELNTDDPRLWYLAGRWLGDGWRRHDRKDVIICCGKHDIEALRKVVERAGMNASYSEQETVIRAVMHNAELYEFIGMFGDGARNKFIPEAVLKLPKRHLKAFIRGYLSADGYRQKDGVYKVCSVSYELILGLQAAIAKVYGQPTTITVKDNSGKPIMGREVDTALAYCLQFTLEKRKQQHFFSDENYLWVPFRSSEKINGCETVYNMSVSNDESYTVFNYAVHNCSTFSMAGSRENAWGKEKRFREGQAKQVLSDLFFEFIKVAELLKPKVVVAENVRGMVSGNAKGYVNLIRKEFDRIGYDTQLFLLNSATMGVPQRRERVFFICRRKDLGMPKITLSFKHRPVLYEEFADSTYIPFTPGTMYEQRWKKRKITDRNYADTVIREEGKNSGFNQPYIKMKEVACTLTAGSRHIRMDKPGFITDRDVCIISTFPLDYDFGKNDPGYVCGMSVPPFMMRGVADAVAKQLLPFAKE